MTLKKGFVLRQVGGKYMVVAVGAATLDFRSIITLNETGAFLWQQLQEETTAEDLVAALLAEYEVTEELACADVDTFLGSLREAQLLDE